MSNNTKKQATTGNTLRFFDLLDSKSLAVMSRFGFIYKNKYSGKQDIRIFKK